MTRILNTCARFLFAGMLLVAVDAIASANSTAIHVRGSTTLQPVAQKIAEDYMASHPGKLVVISGGGTGRGYKAVLDDTADIAMASSLIPSDVESRRQLQMIELQSTLVGYAALLGVVNPGNPVSDLSLRQLKDIFTGRIDNWKRVGGRNAPISVYVGPPTGGINDTWKSLILDEEDSYTPTGKVLPNAERTVAVVTDPNAITFVTRGQTDLSHVKILSIDHTAANAGDVRQGNYVLRAPLLLVSRKKPGKDVEDFIQYFVAQLQSAEWDLIALQEQVHGGAHHE